MKQLVKEFLEMTKPYNLVATCISDNRPMRRFLSSIGMEEAAVVVTMKARA